MNSQSYYTLHHIFTDDMTWNDNLAILKALQHITKHKGTPIKVKGWICIDKNQLYTKSNPYSGLPATISFLQACQSLLSERKSALGPIQIVESSTVKLASELTPSDDTFISIARQYTPFGLKRQNAIQKLWKDHFLCHDNRSLMTPKKLKTIKNKDQYLVFSPFYKLVSESLSKYESNNILHTLTSHVLKPSSIKHIDNEIIDTYLKQFSKQWSPKPILNTNRPLALRRITHLKEKWGPSTYGSIRNHINIETSQLSRFLNTGVITIREVWDQLGYTMPDFGRQLIFRNFYICRMAATATETSFPTNELPPPKWLSPSSDTGKHYWNAWIKGKTGVPIIDAAMRCLRNTGTMHNRLRMLTSSYLTRILRIHWKHGEAWFAKHLFDYEATQNHFGWKGQAALSLDSRQYYRVFNPWTQTTKYDPECVFIKQWIPALRPVKVDTILNWEDYHNTVQDISYPKPIIVNHSEAAKRSIAAWKDAISKSS